MNKITYVNKRDVVPLTDEETQITAGDLNMIKEVVNGIVDEIIRLKNAPRKGVQDAPKISLMTNEMTEYVTPNNVRTLALVVNGVGTVQVGISESEIGSLGEIESNGMAIMQMGLISNDLWLRSDAPVEVTPIIYVK